MPTVRTRRLLLRPLVAADAERIADLAGDFAVASMTARIPYPYDARQSLAWITGLDEGEFVRGIEYRGELIGAVGHFRHDDGAIEIGYWIGRPWWGRGFATEAARLIVRHGFTTANAERLVCCHFVDNLASERVIAKLGFRRLGTCRAYCEARGREIATVRYEMRRPRTAWLWRRVA